MLEDGTMKVFLNSKGTADDISEELKNFLDLVNGLQPRDEFCREVDREVQKAKRSAAVWRSFMDMEDKLLGIEPSGIGSRYWLATVR